MDVDGLGKMEDFELPENAVWEDPGRPGVDD